MPDTKWINQFPAKVKPTYEELLMFLPDRVRPLFLRFNDEMNRAYQVYNKWHRYEKHAGWVYGYCRNYRCELLCVSIGDGFFRVLDIDVMDGESLHQALQKAKEAYENGYEERYANLSAEKRANQILRAKVRLTSEKEELRKILEDLDKDRFNRFRWAPKVSRAELIRLYKGEAQGLPDGELLDSVGYAFYARCRQAQETRAYLDQGKIVCHNCGAILSPAGEAAVIFCLCGDCYTYREYRRSCNAASMPGGRAAPIFHSFVESWPRCKDGSEKMLLIDRLIHECHVTVMSGNKGRSVCVNLIEGTAAQLRDMLETLAGHV